MRKIKVIGYSILMVLLIVSGGIYIYWLSGYYREKNPDSRILKNDKKLLIGDTLVFDYPQDHLRSSEGSEFTNLLEG